MKQKYRSLGHDQLKSRVEGSGVAFIHVCRRPRESESCGPPAAFDRKGW